MYPCELGLVATNKGVARLISIDFSPYEYFRTGSGQFCEHGAVVTAVVGHPPTEHCHPKPVYLHDKCGRAICSRPECYEGVITRQAREVERHCAEAVDLFSDYRSHGVGEAKQFIFSPSQDGRGTVYLGKRLSKPVTRVVDGQLVTSRRNLRQRAWTREEMIADGARTMERELLAILKEIFRDGFYLGSLVVHMERKRHEDGSECDDGSCELDHKWVWGPHVHGTVYGYITLNSDDFHAEYGWIYKLVDAGSQRDVYSTVRYQLSHSAHFRRPASMLGTYRSRPAYRMIGLASSYYKGQLKVGEYDERHLCQCSVPFHRYRPGDDNKEYYEQEDLGEYVVHADWKVPYLKLHFRSHCLRSQGVLDNIYPRHHYPEVHDRVSRDRARRQFMKELSCQDPDGRRFGFNNPALIFHPEPRVKRRCPKWYEKISWHVTPEGGFVKGWNRAIVEMRYGHESSTQGEATAEARD